MNLPKGSLLLGDRAYTNYSFEQILKATKGVQLLAKRKSNHKQQHTSEEENLIKKYRNRIETVFSSITSRMPRQIKAKTEQGFCLKVLFLVLAYMMSLYFRFS